LANLEVCGLHHASSITKDAAKNVGFYTGVLGMRLLYRSVLFDVPLGLRWRCEQEGPEEGPTQVDLAAVRRIGRRVAEKAGLLVGGRAHV